MQFFFSFNTATFASLVLQATTLSYILESLSRASKQEHPSASVVLLVKHLSTESKNALASTPHWRRTASAESSMEKVQALFISSLQLSNVARVSREKQLISCQYCQIVKCILYIFIPLKALLDVGALAHFGLFLSPPKAPVSVIKVSLKSSLKS